MKESFKNGLNKHPNSLLVPSSFRCKHMHVVVSWNTTSNCALYLGLDVPLVQKIRISRTKEDKLNQILPSFKDFVHAVLCQRLLWLHAFGQNAKYVRTMWRDRPTNIKVTALINLALWQWPQSWRKFIQYRSSYNNIYNTNVKAIALHNCLLAS